MSKDDEVCLSLGREICRMIRDVAKVSGRDTGYARRTLTFPGGEVCILVTTDSKVADLMEAGVRSGFYVAEAIPPSTRN